MPVAEESPRGQRTGPAVPLLPLTANPDGLERPLEGRERLDVPRILGYGGAGVVIFAVYAVMVVVARHGGWSTLGVALAYALPLLAGAWAYARNGIRRTPGLFVTVAVTLAPWVVWAVERIADWSPGSSEFASASIPPSAVRRTAVVIGAGA